MINVTEEEEKKNNYSVIFFSSFLLRHLSKNATIRRKGDGDERKMFRDDISQIKILKERNKII